MLGISLRTLNREERNLYDFLQTVPGFHFSSHLPCGAQRLQLNQVPNLDLSILNTLILENLEI